MLGPGSARTSTVTGAVRGLRVASAGIFGLVSGLVTGVYIFVID